MAKIDRVQEVSVDLLKPYENNAKIHSEEQVQKIADSIEEFGFISPCLIDKENRIIAGHGRVMAAKILGMKKVPCVYVEGLTDAQRRNRKTDPGDIQHPEKIRTKPAPLQTAERIQNSETIYDGGETWQKG